MKGIVVYHSRWGSCKRVGEAIARGLAESGHDVRAVAVQEAGEPDASLDFVIVGGSTRAGRAGGKIMRYAKKAAQSGSAGKPFAAFSTGSSVYRKKPNTQASERLHELLLSKGLAPLAEPFKAGVEKEKGSLAEGEEERAFQFGRELGAKLASPS